MTRGDVDPPNGGVSSLRAVVLVEGNSDRVALRTLAERQGRDLDAEGVEVVAMGGITNTRAFATRYGPAGIDLPGQRGGPARTSSAASSTVSTRWRWSAIARPAANAVSAGHTGTTRVQCSRPTSTTTGSVAPARE